MQRRPIRMTMETAKHLTMSLTQHAYDSQRIRLDSKMTMCFFEIFNISSPFSVVLLALRKISLQKPTKYIFLSNIFIILF